MSDKKGEKEGNVNAEAEDAVGMGCRSKKRG